MQQPARQLFRNLMAIIALCLAVIASPVLRAQTNQPSTSGTKLKQSPSTPPVAPSGVPPGSAAGFQQLAKDRLASDFIQDRVYRFKEAGDLWQPYSIFVPRNYDKSKKWPLI